MNQESQKNWALFWAIAALIANVIWIFNIGFISGIVFAVVFSFIKRLSVKSTITSVLAAAAKGPNPESFARNLLGHINRAFFVCTALQFLILIFAISINQNNYIQADSPRQNIKTPTISPANQSTIDRIQKAEMPTPSMNPQSINQIPIFEQRIWKNSKGDELAATLLELRNNKHGDLWGKFKRANGTIFTYKVSNLSLYDIELINNALENKEYKNLIHNE